MAACIWALLRSGNWKFRWHRILSLVYSRLFESSWQYTSINPQNLIYFEARFSILLYLLFIKFWRIRIILQFNQKGTRTTCQLLKSVLAIVEKCASAHQQKLHLSRLMNWRRASWKDHKARFYQHLGELNLAGLWKHFWVFSAIFLRVYGPLAASTPPNMATPLISNWNLGHYTKVDFSNLGFYLPLFIQSHFKLQICSFSILKWFIDGAFSTVIDKEF